MIAKFAKNKGAGTVSDSVNYAQREEKYQKIEKDLPQEKKAECILLNNLSSSEAKVIKSEFSEVNGGNKRIETNKKHSHEIISFSEKDIKTLDTPQKRAEAVERYLEYRGIRKDNFQYGAWEHKDTKNIHIHVVYNRVGLDGEVIKARNKFETMAVACERTEKDLKLENDIQRKVIHAPETERGYIKNPAIDKGKTIIKEPKSKAKSLDQKKAFIQDKISESIQKWRIDNPEQLKTYLQKSNITFEYKTNIKGLSHTSFKYDKIAVKGSQIGLKASVIDKQFKANLEYNNAQEKDNKIAKLIGKEKGGIAEIEHKYNSVIQQNRGIDIKTELEKYQVKEPKTAESKEFNAMMKKSFDDLDLKQQKFQLEFKKYEELKSQQPQKVPLISFNKLEIIKQNEELIRKQNQAKPPQLPRFELLSNYEEMIEKKFRIQENINLKPKNTYEMEKKQAKTKSQEQSKGKSRGFSR